MQYIGIDAGVNTGVSIIDQGKYVDVTSMKIHQALQFILFKHDLLKEELTVIVEDARINTWGGTKYGSKKDLSRIQGAGSIKRDCKIWEDFLVDHKIKHELVPINKSLTKN